MAWGLNQISNPTPATATWVFRVVLYVASLGNIAIITFTRIPVETKLDIAAWSSFITLAIHLASKTFGIPLPDNAEIPAKDVASLTTDKPEVK